MRLYSVIDTENSFGQLSTSPRELDSHFARTAIASRRYPLQATAQLYRDKAVAENANIGAALSHVRAAAEQYKDLDRWSCLLRYIGDRIAPVIGPPRPPPGLQATG